MTVDPKHSSDEECAVMQSSEHEKSLTRAAEACMANGRLDEAITAYRQLLSLNPGLADAWYNLGYLHRCRRHFEPAITAYRMALSCHVVRPEEVHLNLAVILSEHLNRVDEAEVELQSALGLNPDFVPALLNLGNLQEDMGQSQQARSSYRNVLEIEPENGRAAGRLAMIDVFEGKAGDAVPVLQAALDAGPPTPDDRAELGFALGHARDALGEYDAAFAALAAANNAMREATPPSFRYDPDTQERLVDDLIRIFPVATTNDPEPATREPVFICGMFRSGSTLAESILASHSRVTAGGEFEFLPALVAEKLQPYPQSLISAGPPFREELRATYLEELAAIHPQHDMITDKRPDNFLHIGLIKTLFPSAKIVHTFRNPLDNILSVYFGNFDQSVSYGNRLDDIAHWYIQYQRLMAHWRMLFGDDIFELDYDRVVANPEASIRPLIAFCGLDWEDACLKRNSVQDAVRTLSSWQVRQPLHSRSSGRWRNYATHLEKVREMMDLA